MMEQEVRHGEAAIDVSREVRTQTDTKISEWAARIDYNWLQEDQSWFNVSVGRELRTPRGVLVVHFSDHQTHHRGQAHAMIAAAGADRRYSPIPDRLNATCLMSRGPLGVKLRITQCEQMSSGLPLKTDIAQYGRRVSNLPRADLSTKPNRATLLFKNKNKSFCGFQRK